MKMALKVAAVFLFFCSILIYLKATNVMHKSNDTTQEAGYISKYFKHYYTLKSGTWLAKAVPLQDGKILILDNNPAEIFDPITKTSELIPGMKDKFGCWVDPINANALPNGNVLITGEFECQNHKKLHKPEGAGLDFVLYRPPTHAVLYNFKQKSFEKVPFALTTLPQNTVSFNLPNNKTLLIGTRIIEGRIIKPESVKTYDWAIIDADTLKVEYEGNLKERRTSFSAYQLNPDEVIIFAGQWPDSGTSMGRLGSVRSNTVEVFNVKTRTSKLIDSLQFVKGASSPYDIELDHSRYAFLSIRVPGKLEPIIEIFDYKNPEENIVFDIVDITPGEAFSPSAKLPNGKILSVSENVREIDIKTQKTRIIDKLPAPIPRTFIWTKNGKLLAFMKSFDSKASKNVYVFDYQKYEREN